MNIKTLLNKLPLFLLSMIILSAAVSCKKDDDDDKDKDPTPDPTYNFINQPLQGKIKGNPWTLVSGGAELSFFDSTELSINMWQVTDTAGCSSFLDGNSIFFFCPNAIGLYLLSFTGTNPQTITLYDTGTAINVISTEGALQILSIDTIAKTVTGKMDAQVDANTFANGNFTITYCN